nr:MAG TPA: hypothetical protein [Caudoviricetes sp.]
MSAFEYIAHLAATEPIMAVAEEIKLVISESPSVALDELVDGLWEQISRYYI